MKNNIVARIKFTRRLSEDTPAEKLFGWVYREPGMPTLSDCLQLLFRISARFEGMATYDMMARYGVEHMGDLWVGSYGLFIEFGEACLKYGVPPSASWDGGCYGDPFVPHNAFER
jgi:hypothetical protein